MSFDHGDLVDLVDLDVYLTELLLDPCESNKVKEVKALLDVDLDTICATYGDVKEKKKKADKLVCIAHPTDPLRFTIRKVTKHKTRRVNGRWVV